MCLILLQATPASNPLLQFGPILLIFAIFYFLLFMPMQRQKKKQQQMLAGLKTGDIVLTNGGIMGTIVAINDDDTIVRAGQARRGEAADGAGRGGQHGEPRGQVLIRACSGEEPASGRGIRNRNSRSGNQE